MKEKKKNEEQRNIEYKNIKYNNDTDDNNEVSEKNPKTTDMTKGNICGSAYYRKFVSTNI